MGRTSSNENATPCGHGAHQWRRMAMNLRFHGCPRNPLRTSCVPKAPMQVKLRLLHIPAPLIGCDNVCLIFFLARCARGVCKLSETEFARIYVPTCCCYIGKREKAKERERERVKGKERGRGKRRCYWSVETTLACRLQATTLRYISPFTRSPQTHFPPLYVVKKFLGQSSSSSLTC